jgi:hypothetical protein
LEPLEIGRESRVDLRLQMRGIEAVDADVNHIVGRLARLCSEGEKSAKQ